MPSVVSTSSQLKRKRSPSPAARRRQTLRYQIGPNIPFPRSFTVEAICALPHTGPVHSLASSMCMSHLLTGSEDGYIRDYDIFTALNGKTFLSAPQRHHAGVVEGLMKAGQLHFWWENPAAPSSKKSNGALLDDDSGLSPVYSLAMHSDALWALGGSDTGHINLCTVRHEPGRLCHVMNGHKGPVSGLAIDYDEKSFFSAGWDGDAIQWDLNTGQGVRNFTAHGAQLAAIALRPQSHGYSNYSTPVFMRSETFSNDQSQTIAGSTQETIHGTNITSTEAVVNDSSANASSKPNAGDADNLPPATDSDSKSDVSFDPLFDGEYGDDGNGMDTEPQTKPDPAAFESKIAMPGFQNATQPVSALPPPPRPTTIVAPPKSAPPLLDPINYATFSPDLLLTASIDGQVILWDRRTNTPGKGVGRLWLSEKTPPWCLSACWSADGSQIYAGRRNGTVDVWDVRLLGRSGLANTPRLLKTLRNPASSGVVSCVVAFPDGRHIACASFDNLRLWNVAEAGELDSGRSKSGVQFKIIPGHHGGYVSQMLVDPGCRFLVSASSNRGWHGDSTKTVFVHDIKSNM